MGKMLKRLSKKSSKPFVPYANPAPIRKLHAEAEVLANVVVRKVKPGAISAQEREDMWIEGYQEGFAEAIASVANLLMNDWGHLYARDTRLAEAYARIQRYREQLDNPSEAQLKAEVEFIKQTGVPMGRTPRDANM